MQIIDSNIQSVVFDCDGVLFDSNYIKSESFAEVISGEIPEAISAFLAFHSANGGVSRYEKFNWFYRDALGRADWAALSKKASENFADTVQKRLMQAAMVPGALSLLQQLKAREVRCFVVSGGAHNEVNELISSRGLGEYFDEVLGSPISKKEHLQRLQVAGKLVSPALFVGDATSDLQAAEAFSMKFVFVQQYSLWANGAQVCSELGWPVINDLTGLQCKQ